MCFYDKGILRKVEKNSEYENSWTIVTSKGKHFTNSRQVAEKCGSLIGKSVDLDIMRYGRVIGVRPKNQTTLEMIR